MNVFMNRQGMGIWKEAVVAYLKFLSQPFFWK
jgi:hypothetical protein